MRAERIKLIPHMEVSIGVLQGAPQIRDPESGCQIDPISLYMRFIWADSTRSWVLLEVLLSGVEVTEEGEYPDVPDVEVRFLDNDPALSEEEGGFPVWVREMALRCAPVLPIPRNLGPRAVQVAVEKPACVRETLKPGPEEESVGKRQAHSATDTEGTDDGVAT